MADDNDSPSDDAKSSGSTSESSDELTAGAKKETGETTNVAANAAAKGDTAEKGAGKEPSGDYEFTTAIPGSIPRRAQSDGDTGSSGDGSSGDSSSSSDNSDG